ncbi:hypothetical protein D3C71_1858190 [compost metagenome]
MSGQHGGIYIAAHDGDAICIGGLHQLHRHIQPAGDDNTRRFIQAKPFHSVLALRFGQPLKKSQLRLAEDLHPVLRVIFEVTCHFKTGTA